MTDFETKYRDLVAGLEATERKVNAKALALWSGTSANLVAASAVSDILADLRALLASSPAEREGEGSAGVHERCNRCGGPNVIWAASSPLWNYVMRGNDINGEPLFRDLVCMHAESAHLDNTGTCSAESEDWSGARCDCRRFGEMAFTRQMRETAPAPVSSGEAGEPWPLYCAEEYEVLSGRVRSWQGAVKESAAERLAERLNAERPVGATTRFRVALTPSPPPAPVAAPSTEGDETDG